MQKHNLHRDQYEVYFMIYMERHVYFIKIEVCGKYVRFSNIGENTKEDLTDFIVVLIFRHFMV